MTTSWILLTAACFFVKANSVENIYSDNGWRPTSSEKVFELQRNFIKTPLSVQMRNVQGNPMDNIFQRNAIKIVQPNHLNRESIKADEAIFSFRKENERNGRSFEDPSRKYLVAVPYRQADLNTPNNFESMQPRHVKNNENTKIASNNLIHHEIKYIHEMPSEDINKEEITKTINTYEVNEILEEDLSDQKVKPRHSNVHEIEEPKAVDNQALKPLNKVYTHERSNFETNSHKNLTTTLFKILANYNIRTGDKLPNYGLSLRQNSRNSGSNDFMYMHVPLKIPLRYNSPNHVPIDPLLAVFLSNYGHYLPGLYGFQTSYNNLYGYLASNNIHNNRPFGSYKVFSDTDSSQ